MSGTKGYGNPQRVYGISYKDLCPDDQWLDVRIFKVPRLIRPSQSIAYADALDHLIYNYDPTSGDRGYFLFGEKAPTGKGVIAPRHDKMINATFFDGHAGSLGWQDVKSNASRYFQNFYKQK